jgi:hypothetical protein
VKIELIFYAQILRQFGLVSTLRARAKKHTWKKEGRKILGLPADHLPNGESFAASKLHCEEEEEEEESLQSSYTFVPLPSLPTSPPLVLLQPSPFHKKHAVAIPRLAIALRHHTQVIDSLLKLQYLNINQSGKHSFPVLGFLSM